MSKRGAWVRTAWARFQSSFWRRTLEVALVIVALALMVRALAASLSQLDISNLRIDLPSLLIAVFITLVTVWIGAFAWGAIVRALHPEVPYLTAVQQHLLSLPTKYLPGFGWQQVSKAVQLHRSGISMDRTAVAVLIEIGLVILTGLATAAQLLGYAQDRIPGLTLDPTFHFFVTTLLWLACLLAPLILFRLAMRSRSSSVERNRLVLYLWLAELLQIIAWLTFGSALWFTARTIVPLSIDVLPYCIVTLIVSFIVSLLIFIVPNGIGVRELTMSTLLQVITSVPLSITLAVMSRVVLVVAEFLGALPILFKRIGQRIVRDWY